MAQLNDGKIEKLQLDSVKMSSDVDDDQVLPESLQKLEIVSVYTHSQSACKANNERHNPFFSELSTANRIDDQLTKDLFGPTCNNCESSDNSVNSSKDVSSNKSWRHRGSSVSQCIEHNINKQIHFKHRDKEKSQVLSEKKLTILREPILKSIGRSMYHNGNRSKTCCELNSSVEQQQNQQKLSKIDLESNEQNSIWFSPLKLCDESGNEQLKMKYSSMSKSQTELNTSTKCQQVPGTVADTNNVMIQKVQNWQLNDDLTVDFKSLVNECDNLSLSTPETAINSNIEIHKSKNFQVLQANQIENMVGSTSGSVGDAPLSNSSANINATTTVLGAGNSAMSNSSSSNNSNSSSCSQQARMNSSNCDVTIDELASYIEFQLHLPKPMSSNVYEAMFS